MLPFSTVFTSRKRYSVAEEAAQCLGRFELQAGGCLLFTRFATLFEPPEKCLKFLPHLIFRSLLAAFF